MEEIMDIVERNARMAKIANGVKLLIELRTFKDASHKYDAMIDLIQQSVKHCTDAYIALMNLSHFVFDENKRNATEIHAFIVSLERNAKANELTGKFAKVTGADEGVFYEYFARKYAGLVRSVRRWCIEIGIEI